MLLVGEKVRLRRAMPADLEDRVRWNSDPRVMEFLHRGAVPSSREETLAYLRTAAEQTSEYIELAIETQTGKHIGGTTLRNFDWRSRKAEFAIMIGEPEQWSLGYGTDATRLMLKLAFENLNLNRVWLTVDASNQRGITAYERAGFKQEGRLRQDRYMRGVYEDGIVMGILREDWQAGAGDPRVS